MPVVLTVGNLKFFFFSNEGNPREPVHIHVRSGSNEAKFWLKTAVSLAYNRGFDSRTLGKIQPLIEQNQTFFEEAWHDHFA